MAIKTSKTNLKKNFYVTTPIYYPNDIPHIGHAYTTLAADVLARWHKLLGKEVFFLTGTDEHGKKIEETATKNGKKPKEFVDELVPKFKDAWKKLNINYDCFIRTTDKHHEKIVQEMLQKSFDNGDIYPSDYEGLYCVGCEAYYSEKDLLEGNICPIHKKPIQKLKEPSYFFKLSKYQDRLLKLYNENPNFILPKHRANEVINRVKEGLKDLSISRTSFDWGIKLPFDKKHIAYVWFDALFNYYSATTEKGKEDFWPANVHLIGKDILWFHTVYWPAFLMSVGLNLPHSVFAHGWWTFDKEKISKSQGKVININELIAIAGADSARYFLFRGGTFGEDGDFSERSLVERHNNELANKLGNLVSRVSALAEKYGLEKDNFRKAKEKIPIETVKGKTSTKSNISLEDLINIIRKSRYIIYRRTSDGSNKLVIDILSGEDKIYVFDYPRLSLAGVITKEIIEKNIEKFEIDKCLNWLFLLIDNCNEYVQDKKPWETGDKKVLYELACSIKDFTILLSPFMPETCQKIAETFDFNLDFKELDKSLKISKIKKSEILFTKVEYKEKENLNKQEIPGIVNMGNIQFGDWEKIKLVVGQIIEVEEIVGADKLYKLTVDIGEEKRTICSGIKKYYKISELKNKKIILLKNLEPRKMKGVESCGMLLAAGSADSDTCVLISPEKDVPNGTSIS